MRVFIVVLLVINILSAKEKDNFISKFEYGQMLYENPRGVSCKRCHGPLGKGSFIASFIDSKGKIHKFYGSDIRNLDFATFKKQVETGGRIMPRFYLTNKELEAIYNFIKIVNLPPKEQEEAINNSNEMEFDTKVVIKEQKTSAKKPTKKKELKDEIIEDIDNEPIDEIEEINNDDIFEDRKPKPKEDKNKNSIIIDMFNDISNEDFIENPPSENLEEESY